MDTGERNKFGVDIFQMANAGRWEISHVNTPGRQIRFRKHVPQDRRLVAVDDPYGPESRFPPRRSEDDDARQRTGVDDIVVAIRPAGLHLHYRRQILGLEKVAKLPRTTTLLAASSSIGARCNNLGYDAVSQEDGVIGYGGRDDFPVSGSHTGLESLRSHLAWKFADLQVRVKGNTGGISVNILFRRSLTVREEGNGRLVVLPQGKY